MEGWRISVGNWECAVCQIRGNLLVVLMSTVRALLGKKQGTLRVTFNMLERKKREKKRRGGGEGKKKKRQRSRHSPATCHIPRQESSQRKEPFLQEATAAQESLLNPLRWREPARLTRGFQSRKEPQPCPLSPKKERERLKLANYNYHHLSFSLPPSSPPPLPCSPTPPSAPASLRRGRFWRGSPAGVLQMVPKLHLHYPPTSQPHLHSSLCTPPPFRSSVKPNSTSSRHTSRVEAGRPEQRWVSQARISDSMEIPLLAERKSNGGVYDSLSIPRRDSTQQQTVMRT
ncbi:hypothetical protein QQF64_017159 [Cirrhinus molitorella]|uniref:Uncharacterized protein n=1 Tax=Cirrhinus molitorella TaxID=172907 RepID=A0ABR3LK85_9TELE